MTREEAIEIFLNHGWIKLEGGTYFDGDKWREAIMVISDYFKNEYKALKQEPCYVSKLTQKAYEDGKKDGYVQAKVEQEPILDKIREEIMQLDYNLESIDYDHNDMAMTEEVHMICREELLQIIDRYRVESEDK